MPINVRLDVLLAERKMKRNTLSEQVGITVPNLSVLENGKAKAIRMSTLEALCRALDCQPGDLLHYEPEEPRDGDATGPGSTGPPPRAP